MYGTPPFEVRMLYGSNVFVLVVDLVVPFQHPLVEKERVFQPFDAHFPLLLISHSFKDFICLSSMLQNLKIQDTILIVKFSRVYAEKGVI